MRSRLIRALAIPAAAIGTLALAGASTTPSPAHPAGAAAAPPPTAYVTNNGSNTVTAINTVTNKAYGTIKVGSSPGNILIAPNGKTAYIAGSTGVTPVSTITHKAGKLIAIKYGAVNMAITPDGKTLYVTNFSWYTRDNTVIPVSTATGKVGKPITWQPGAEWGASPLLVTPNGKTLYVASTLGTVTAISTATNKAGKPITFGGQAENGAVYMAITPNGKTLYAFGSGPYGPGNTVTPISTATNKAGKPITVGQWPVAIVVTPNGKTVYVASTGSGPTGCFMKSPQCGPARPTSVPATVTPISTATNRPGKAITLGPTASSLTMAITPNGRTVYVHYSWFVAGHGSSAMIPISTATNRAGKPVKLSSWGAGAIAITPNAKTIYCLSATSTGQGVVIPVRIPAGTVLKAIHVGNWPIAIAIAP